MNDNQKGSTLAVWALIVALIALGFSIVAFNRSGQDLHEVVQEETVEAARTAEQVAARARAEARLAAVRAELAAERGYVEASEEVAEVRADLAAAYESASAEAREEWRELDSELERLEQNVRDESADALLIAEGLIALLRQDVRTDED